MMRLSSNNEGVMTGLAFREPETPEGETETIHFDVRRAATCVELHIVSRIHKPSGKCVARHLLHSYSNEAYAELVSLLQSRL